MPRPTIGQNIAADIDLAAPCPQFMKCVVGFDTIDAVPQFEALEVAQLPKAFGIKGGIVTPKCVYGSQ